MFQIYKNKRHSAQRSLSLHIPKLFWTVARSLPPSLPPSSHPPKKELRTKKYSEENAEVSEAKQLITILLEISEVKLNQRKLKIVLNQRRLLLIESYWLKKPALKGSSSRMKADPPFMKLQIVK